MADTPGLPPEGWYPDRPNATRLRHWTGTGWTNEFRPLPSDAAPAPEASGPVRETTDPARTRRELRAQVGALVVEQPLVVGQPAVPPATAEAPPGPEEVVPQAATPPQAATAPQADPERVPQRAEEPDRGLSSADRARAAGGYPPVRQQAWQESFAATAERPAGSSQTLAGWLYAASPLWLGALIIAGSSLLSIVNPLLVQGGLSVVGFVLTLLLARLDIRQLRARGYRAPSLWWVLLPFVYFLIRMVRVGVRGAGMTVTYLLASVALSGLVYLSVIGNPALLSVLSPSVPAESTPIPSPETTLSVQERANILTEAGTEAQLRLDLAKTFDVGDVDCVPFPSTAARTTTTCVVVLDGAPYNAGLEVTPDDPGTAFVLTGMLPVEN
ncbi:hypothetical protein BH09ACT5_BH09ACT5_07770 [soil metagenome]